VNAGPFRASAHSHLEVTPRQLRRICGERTRRARDDNFFRDRAEIGSKVHGALFTRIRISSGLMPTVRYMFRRGAAPWLNLPRRGRLRFLETPIRPRSAGFPVHHGAAIDETSVRERFDFRKLRVMVSSPLTLGQPPKAISILAPTPALCAAAAAAGSTIKPIAAFSAPSASSALKIPVVFESPPTPGLSCVSAMDDRLVRFPGDLYRPPHCCRWLFEFHRPFRLGPQYF